jgi:hypothetical protein
VYVLCWDAVIYGQELHCLISEPEFLIGIALVFRLKVVLCFFWLCRLLDSQLASLEVCGRAGVCHVLINVLWWQVYNILQGKH